MRLVFATHNQNKVKEIQALVPNNIEIVSLDDIGCTEEIPETAETLEGNAWIKANYVRQKYGLPCFADDTGLEIDALNGEPGVYSARYAGEQKNAEDNMALVLSKLSNERNRTAQFRTAISLIIDHKEYLFEGVVRGEITPEKRGTEGFGYDPIFEPENSLLTFAQMDLNEKNKISHRGRAFAKMIAFLYEL